MTYQDQDRVNMKKQLSKEAIDMALQGKWREAVDLNKKIIENFPNDVDSFNRLGRAHMELDEFNQAKEAYTKAAELDPFNKIAKKNLSRLSFLAEGAVATKDGSHRVEQPHEFIEEVGKAGTVNLHRLASLDVLARVNAGEKVNLKIDGSNLVVESTRGEYLGLVEPKHGQRLVKLMEGGNRYSAAIVSVAENAVSVIIRETYQHPSQAGRPSFPSRGTEEFQPYVSDRILRREIEYEGETEGRAFTVVGGEETEGTPEEAPELEEEEEVEEVDDIEEGGN